MASKPVKTDLTTQNRKGAMPVWDEGEMRRRTRRRLWVLISVLGVLWVVLLVWVAIAPIEDAKAVELAADASLTVVLAPVLVAATGVERLLETAFNTLESVWRSVVAYLGYGMRWLKSAETEVAKAREWLQSMGAIYNGTLAADNQQVTAILEQHRQEMLKTLSEALAVAEDAGLKSFLEGAHQQIEATSAESLVKIVDALVLPADLPVPPNLLARINSARTTLLDNLKKLRDAAEAKTVLAQTMLEAAQAHVKAAESKLAAATDSPDYRSAKGAASIVLGLMLGVVVATVGQIQMFALLGIGAVPARIDVLITGLIIGTGSYPVHSLVGILQQSKDTLDSVKGYFNRSEPQQKSTITARQPASADTGGATVVATVSKQTVEESPNP